MQSRAGKLEDATVAFERAVAKSNDDPRLIRDYADVLQRRRKFDEATRLFEKLIEIEPHRRIAYYRMLVQLQMRQGNRDAARELAEKLVELAPDDIGTYQLRVEVARWSGDRNGQIALLSEAVRSMPQDVTVRRQLAYALADRGDHEQALAEFWRCWELTPELSERISLVAAMSDMLQSSVLRQSLFDRLHAVRKAQPRAVGICLAEAYRRTGDFAQARRALTALLAEDDRDVDVLRQLAALAAEEKDWQAALRHQQQVVNLDDAWTNVIDWSRYYSESKRDEWLSDSRERQRQLMQAWAATFRDYRSLQTDDPNEPEAQALRQELVNLNWARNKYHDKEQLLDPNSTYQRRYGDIWHQLRLDFEILELTSRAPVTEDQIERRLADAIRKVRTSAPYVLEKLCEKEFLQKRTVDGVVEYVASFPAEELLEIAIRDFGERMLGAEIELSDVELVKLQRLVDRAGASASGDGS